DGRQRALFGVVGTGFEPVYSFPESGFTEWVEWHVQVHPCLTSTPDQPDRSRWGQARQRTKLLKQAEQVADFSFECRADECPQVTALRSDETCTANEKTGPRPASPRHPPSTRVDGGPEGAPPCLSPSPMRLLGDATQRAGSASVPGEPNRMHCEASDRVGK